MTASMLYDLVGCPHRVSMDLFADPAERDKVSPFVQLLWERGSAHEEQVVAKLVGEDIARALVEDNPAAILAGEALPYLPVPVSR